MSESAMRFLASLELPGNVRQLENLCNWITVMAPGQTVEVKDLPRDLTQAPPVGVAHAGPLLAEGGAAQPLSMPPTPDGWIGLLELQAASARHAATTSRYPRSTRRASQP